MSFLKCASLFAFPLNLRSCRNVPKHFFNKFYCNLSPYNINLELNGTSLNNYIKKLEKEYELLNQSNTHRSRWIELQPVMQLLEDRRNIVHNIDNLKDLLSENDNEMRKLVEEEKSVLEGQIKEVDEKLLQALIPTNKEDICDAIVLEVQSGVGGQEAMLFAKELFEMYCKYAEYKGWEVEIADYVETDLGGIRYATALINGPSVYRYIKHEAGVHRVQRTPATEKAGRVHTSTASVIALPQPTDIEVSINPNDLKIETKRSTGAGGQHVNTTDSAVRIVHLPTGVAVECQVDRSQIKNKKMAMARLKAILYQKKLDAQNADIEATRKSQVRTKNRNEKIRTYNFNQDRITDHRIGANLHNMKVFFLGGEPLDNLIQELDEHYCVENLLSIVKDT
ncbi:mitochondrial translation release factor 1 isoform X2 [Leptinotarsa decemlineata]|uniref:mitochondrial translation release factor 1 isoform X2 n=1 Tax=Leptinotarsa decemlineata TaxID=7539 RepID=UPI003D30B34B